MDKFLLAVVLAACAIFILAISAVAVISRSPLAETSPKASTLPATSATSTAMYADGGETSAAPSDRSFSGDQPNISDVPTPQTDHYSVQPSDLKKLLSRVHLTGSRPTNADKNLWATQLQVAEQLAQGMCSCDQRNWLNRFILTAKLALAGSDEYFHSAEILATISKSIVVNPPNGATSPSSG